MSLLNDMLRDLSQHKPVADGAEGYDDSLLHASSIVRPKSQPWRQLALVFAAIFIIVLAGNYFFQKFYGKAAKPELPNPVVQQKTKPAESVAVPVPVAPKTITPGTAPGTQVTEPDTVSETTVKTEAIETDAARERIASAELQNHIADLLQQAERALGMDRLTSPVEDNAYGYYQKILTMSPDNVDAREGLDRIASRYVLKAQEQIQLGNRAQADALMQRARFVSERYVLAHEIPLDTSMADTSAQILTVPDPLPEQQPLLNQKQSTSETIKPFAVTEASTVSVSTNASWKDEQLARHAQSLISQGKQAEAQALLKVFVAKEQKPVLSAALLAELYIQQDNSTAAEIVVNAANYLPPDVKTKLQAQIFSANGNDTQAIAALEQNLTSAESNESYRALLASLYHKTAKYPQSIISYQRLMQSFGEKPAYWLGLALAYDGLSQHKSALQAYQRLREYPQIQEQVKKYTDQRIAALRSE